MKIHGTDRQFRIQAIALEGYRAFASRTEIRVRPVTVLTGESGSGKSAPVRFLRELREALVPDAGPSPAIRPLALHQSRTTGREGPLLFELTGAHENLTLTASGRVVSGEDAWVRLQVSEEGMDTETGEASSRGSRVEDMWEDPPRREHLVSAALAMELMDQLRGVRELGAYRREYEADIAMGNTTQEIGYSGERTLHAVKRITRSGNDSAREFLAEHARTAAGIPGISLHHHGQEMCTAYGNGQTPLGSAGTGALQALPIIARAALMEPGETLAVEHPESGLNPERQLAMGSLFGELWTQRGIRSIVETHSDEVLLRLRRMAASGEMDHRDISVAHFRRDPDTGEISVVNIGVREDGSLEPGLPMSFFGANVVEGIRLGAARKLGEGRQGFAPPLGSPGAL